MSKDLTPWEQAQRAYQDLRGMLETVEKHGVELDTLFLEAPNETDGKQELLKKLAHLCHLCHQGLALCLYHKTAEEMNKEGEAARKEAMALKKDAEERQVKIEEVARSVDEHINKTDEQINKVLKEVHAVCHHCAEKNPVAAVYCRRCGKEFERPEEEEEVEEVEETD